MMAQFGAITVINNTQTTFMITQLPVRHVQFMLKNLVYLVGSSNSGSIKQKTTKKEKKSKSDYKTKINRK